MDDKIREGIRSLAQEPFTPQTIPMLMQLLRDQHERAGYAAPRIVRDRAYGDQPRQHLDLHLSGTSSDAAGPVLLFVPGGGFVGGTKWLPGSPHHDNFGAWACRNGALAVIMDYRLAPAHMWPAAAEDVAAALAWTRENIGEYGGDPDRIVLAGVSAGAAHVASFLAGHGGLGADAACAAALMSGIYDPVPVTAMPHKQLVGSYYGADEAELRSRSTLDAISQWNRPLLITVTEFDSIDFHEQAFLALEARFRRHGVLPRFTVVPDHMHSSDVLSLGVDASALDHALRELLAQVSGRTAIKGS